jgi:Cu2+-exporting ATPase
MEPDATLTAGAASLARWSAHPLARALAAAVPDADTRWTDVRELPGAGLEARDASGARWRLGSASHVGAHDASVSGGALWFGDDAGARQRFEFDQALRADSIDAVAALRASGLHVTLLSGDRTERAEQVGAQLAVDAAIGAATPQRKLQIVARAQAEGHRVLMVGDGVNDAPVLARADVSVAMGQGAVLARAQADAVITSNRLSALVVARQLAQRTGAVIRQNLLWAALYNAACIPLALAGWLPPWAAGLGMASSSLLVVLNSLRLAR